MKFTLSLVAIAAAAGLASAAPTPELQERQANPYAVAIVSSAASAIVTKAVNEAVSVIGDIADWNKAREQFTQKTTHQMFSQKPSQATAAVCYNEGYIVSNRQQMSDLTSVKFSKGPLHTNYDCFYMWGPDNHFNSQGDGGYINLSIDYTNACQFDKSTSDLYCA